MNEPLMIRQPSTMSDMFNAVAVQAGKQTILQAQPTGEYLIWMTEHETDPVNALLSAALSIMIRRGESAISHSGISIRKVMGVKAPGCNYFWKVTDQTGNEIASGYAVDEAQAASNMAQHLVK